MPEPRAELLARLRAAGAGEGMLAAASRAPDSDLPGLVADYAQAAERPGLQGRWASDSDILGKAARRRR